MVRDQPKDFGLPIGLIQGRLRVDMILGGSWDLKTTSNLLYSPTYSLPNLPYISYPIISRLVRAAVSGY